MWRLRLPLPRRPDGASLLARPRACGSRPGRYPPGRRPVTGTGAEPDRRSEAGRERGAGAGGGIHRPGRAVYELETAARLQKVVILAGLAGTGKTELAKASGRWWQDTGEAERPEWASSRRHRDHPRRNRSRACAGLTKRQMLGSQVPPARTVSSTGAPAAARRRAAATMSCARGTRGLTRWHATHRDAARLPGEVAGRLQPGLHVDQDRADVLVLDDRGRAAAPFSRGEGQGGLEGRPRRRLARVGCSRGHRAS
jgi:hypothetical protein